MSISLDGGTNPTSVEYNGNEVSEVWYKSSPNSPAIMIWPAWVPPAADGVYYRYDGSTTTLYLRGTQADGYSKYNGGNTMKYYDTTKVVTETSIVLPQNSSSMFSGYSSLREVDTTGWDTSGVEKMNNMFSGCNVLPNLDVSDWDVSNLSEMFQMFMACYALKSLDLSNWYTTKIYNIRSAFSGCEKLAGSIDMSGISGKVMAGSYQGTMEMFNECALLTEVDISGLNTSAVSDMQKMFNKCTSLEHVYVGDDWSTTGVTSSRLMFNGCSRLPNWDGTTNVSKAYVGVGGYLERR